MIDSETVLNQKTELLCKGLYLDNELITRYKEQGIQIDFGRKGGAGPLGGRYFILEDGNTMVNVALWNDKIKTNLVLKEKKGDFFEVHDNYNNNLFGNLKLVENPKFYELKTTDGIDMNKIALVHGVDCLASTIYQKCIYWACGEPCKFCGIELSLQYDSTIEEKNAKQMTEVISAAKKEGRCSHMTLTSGTDESVDKGANRYIELLKGVKNDHPNLPLHVQIEALEDMSYINKLKEAGADTIGIHIEVLDNRLRKEITPGKFSISYELYEKNWKHAIDIYGDNQVSSYVLTGFGESKADFINDVEKVISLGVIPYITPVRSIPGKKDLPITNYQDLLEIYKNSGKLMREYGVNPLKNKAGCVRCGGCSAIKEAYIEAK
ncbi:MAG: radical SAM protein [Candidatus Lokiarchaeota archaeon]|nr:radical SAM protein [Candidatus Lokiarchaeota archaeon]